jgi:hypothetical protein
MAWKTRSGRTSDPGQDAERRGTEPRTGILKPGDNTKPEVREAMDRVRDTAQHLRNGDFHAAFYRD